jgi:cyclopropane-fatty-acyl-phospholipid synthase
MSLADAQRMKYRRVIEALEISSADRVLEIGCGWGGFAETAVAETGATITCLTISKAQEKFAQTRISADSLANKVEIRLEDYRDCRGTFDKVVSIEMFEAVGEENWPTYFGTLRERLRPGGQALLQLITVPDHRFEAYRRRVDFVQRYIFPGGMLPSPGALSKHIDDAGLKLREKFLFGASYAETLRRWNDRFQARWGDIRPLGFDERFRRMWTYYLQSCEACFRTGATDVGHYLVERPQ